MKTIAEAKKKIAELEATIENMEDALLRGYEYARDQLCPFCNASTFVSMSKAQARPYLIDQWKVPLTWDEIIDAQKKRMEFYAKTT
jgi:wobble nucleotide-excising tRNase